MMRTLVQRIMWDRRSAPRAAGGSTRFRRLAIETMEDRLLLSAAGDAGVEGGTVFLGSLVPRIAPGSARLLELDGRTVVVFYSQGCLVVCGELDGGSGDSTWASTGAGLAELLDPRPAAPTTKAEARFGPARPELVQFALGDPGSGPADGGMVDVARIAREKVLARTFRTAQSPGEIGATRPATAQTNVTNDLQARTSDRPIPDHVLAKIANGIHGSQGRLAAFDLALRQETTAERLLWCDESDGTPTGDLDASPLELAAAPGPAKALNWRDGSHRWNAVDHPHLVQDAPQWGSRPGGRTQAAGSAASREEQPTTVEPLVVERQIAVSKEAAGERERDDQAAAGDRRPSELASLVVLAGIGYHLASDERWRATAPDRIAVDR